jgi:hypothetical protein
MAQNSEITTHDLMMMVLYVLIHRAGGSITVTEAEYTAAFANPREIGVDVKPGGGEITLRFHERNMGGIVCFDNGHGAGVCGREGEYAVAYSRAQVTCEACLAITAFVKPRHLENRG